MNTLADLGLDLIETKRGGALRVDVDQQSPSDTGRSGVADRATHALLRH
jgi:hypothetical protein